MLTVLNSSINFYIYVGKQGVREMFNCDTSLMSRHRPSDLEETELVGNIGLVTISQCVNYFQTLIEVTRSVTSQNIVASLTTQH